jgi:hypothetical protein
MTASPSFFLVYDPILIFGNIPSNLESTLDFLWIRLELVTKVLGCHIIQAPLARKQLASVVISQAHPHFNLHSPSDGVQDLCHQWLGIDVWRLDENSAFGISQTSQPDQVLRHQNIAVVWGPIRLAVDKSHRNWVMGGM